MKKEVFRGINKTSIEDAKIIITGLCVDKNASNVLGTRLAPKRIRELSNVVTPYAMDGTCISSCNLCDNGDIYKFEDIESVARDVFKFKGLPFFIGGDHSVAIPTEKAFINKCKEENKTPVIIHMDAHADIMSIYQNNPYSHATPNYHALQNGLKDENLTMIGIRSYEDIEVEYLEKHPDIKVYGIEYLREITIPTMLKEIKNKYGKEEYAIYLSLDIDCLDPAYAPGTGTPESFGLTDLELLEIVKFFYHNLNIEAMDLVEISPKADCNDITSYVGIKLLYEIMKYINK